MIINNHCSPLFAIALGLMYGAAAPIASANYKNDIEYTKLQSELGGQTPDGSGVVVAQIEPGVADSANAELVGRVTYMTGSPSGDSHATRVAQFFIGSLSSIASGVTNLLSYENGDWLSTEHPNSLIKWPALDTTTIGGGMLPATNGSRVGNHSYLWSIWSPPLHRLDWYIATDDALQFVAMNSGTASFSNSLPIAYNTVAVGLSNGQNGTGADTGFAIPNEDDALYFPGRAVPHVVAPVCCTSFSTPIAAAAAAVLIQAGHSDSSLSTDVVSQSTTNRAGLLIRNAERSEVIKAALMAGATRNAWYTADSGGVHAYMPKYRVGAGRQTVNGLDTVLGAGQLNVRNSHYIIAAGEQNSSQDGGPGSGTASRGFDYDPAFGGLSGSNIEATYDLPSSIAPRLLTASLAWNIKILGGTEEEPDVFDGTATLHDLDVAVYDMTNPTAPALVQASNSTSENTENLWVGLSANTPYSVRVTRGVGSPAFLWDYGVAWQAVPDGDGDGAPDEKDNCPLVANSAQCDSDNDGYGNRCDVDLNNNGATNAQDNILFSQQLGLPSVGPIFNAADLNCNGAVNAQDTSIKNGLLGSPPGPSAYVP